MLVITVLLFFIASGFAMSTNYTEKIYYTVDDSVLHFEEFIQEYGKNYSDALEKQNRFRIFRQNLMKSNELNAAYPYTIFGITEHFDLTQEEYIGGQCLGSIGFQEIRCRKGTVYSTLLAKDLESFDWRTKNAVTSVKNQGRCNSCYAWSTIGNLEGQYAIKHNKLLDFSVQQIVDCDKTCMGCNNGWMSNAGLYLTNAGGAMLARDYPYQGRRGQCQFNRAKVVAKVAGCRQFPNLDEDNLKVLVQSTGPISVAVDSSNFQFYKGGIFDYCSKKINHAVLLVGFGEENGLPYWIIKNTAGANWGEKGYIRMARGKNACGIVNEQIVSLVVN